MVKNNSFDNDMLLDDALLPTPNQLKYKILIKNKKIQRPANNAPLQSQMSQQFHQSLSPQTSSANHQSGTPTKHLSQMNLKTDLNNVQDLKLKLDIDTDDTGKENNRLKGISVQKSKSFNDTAFNKVNATKPKNKSNNDELATKLAQDNEFVDENLLGRSVYNLII